MIEQEVEMARLRNGNQSARVLIALIKSQLENILSNNKVGQLGGSPAVWQLARKANDPKYVFYEFARIPEAIDAFGLQSWFEERETTDGKVVVMKDPIAEIVACSIPTHATYLSIDLQDPTTDMGSTSYKTDYNK